MDRISLGGEKFTLVVETWDSYERISADCMAMISFSSADSGSKVWLTKPDRIHSTIYADYVERTCGSGYSVKERETSA
ncbi:MAG: hypothetical protein SVE93_03055 [Candidatus Thermoplasmatota archaeon]|nr:hypothetical protein [Candidatus Thermoplasmatota archaeon]